MPQKLPESYAGRECLKILHFMRERGMKPGDRAIGQDQMARMLAVSEDRVQVLYDNLYRCGYLQRSRRGRAVILTLTV